MVSASVLSDVSNFDSKSTEVRRQGRRAQQADQLTGVYFILRLKANLVSLGQLNEGYSKSVMINDGYSQKFCARKTVFTLELEIEEPVSASWPGPNK